jgi:AAA domain
MRVDRARQPIQGIDDASRSHRRRHLVHEVSVECGHGSCDGVASCGRGLAPWMRACVWSRGEPLRRRAHAARAARGVSARPGRRHGPRAELALELAAAARRVSARPGRHWPRPRSTRPMPSSRSIKAVSDPAATELVRQDASLTLSRKKSTRPRRFLGSAQQPPRSSTKPEQLWRGRARRARARPDRRPGARARAAHRGVGIRGSVGKAVPMSLKSPQPTPHLTLAACAGDADVADLPRSALCVDRARRRRLAGAALGGLGGQARRSVDPGSDRWKALREVRMATVDAFQGKQDDIVVYSMVRANTSELRFVSVERSVLPSEAAPGDRRPPRDGQAERASSFRSWAASRPATFSP